MAILQGEGLEYSEVPREQWNGLTHPGRIRLQSFRPGHGEPLTDALVGQGMMSLGGGGYGGSGLPEPREVLQLWGGDLKAVPVGVPEAPKVLSDDGSGAHRYSIIAIGPQGRRAAPSPAATAKGLARLRWDGVSGADSFVVVRDGTEIAGPLRIEGTHKEWTDEAKRP
jgi:hypothetical protein